MIKFFSFLKKIRTNIAVDSLTQHFACFSLVIERSAKTEFPEGHFNVLIR